MALTFDTFLLRSRRIVAALLFVVAMPAAAQGPPEIAWQGAHSGPTTVVAFSPDGTLIASGSSDHMTRLWRAADGLPVRSLLQCTGLGCRGPNAVAFSPDGTLLATAGSSLKLWSVADGALVHTVNVAFASIAFSPDGQTIAGTGGTGYNSVFVKMVRVADGSTSASLLGGGSRVAYSADGSRIAAVGRRGFDVWRTDGASLWHLDGPRGAFAFAPSGNWIVIAGTGVGDYRYDDTIQLYQIGNSVSFASLKRTGTVTSLVFSPDGSYLLAGSWDPNEDFTYGFVDSTGSIRIWSVAWGGPAPIFALRKTYDQATGTSANSAVLSPDGSRLAYVHDTAVVVADFPDTSCQASLAPDSLEFPLSGGSGSFTVATQEDCAWTAASRVPWISITGGESGEGSGVVEFSVDSAELLVPQSRAEGAAYGIVGQIIASGRSFLVNHGGEGDGCFFTLQPEEASFAQGGGDGTFSVYSAPGCSWAATSNDSWIVIPPQVHIGDVGTSYHVDANPGAARVGTFQVGDAIFTVYQEGAPSGEAVMSDGFESGSASAWSEIVDGL